MKVIITMILSASFVAASSGTIAENGLMKAVGVVDNEPKPLIHVKLNRLKSGEHIRELHGDVLRLPHTKKSLKRSYRLAEFKAKLKRQKKQRRQGMDKNQFTIAF